MPTIRSILSAPIAAVAVLSAASHMIWHRSLSATRFERFLRQRNSGMYDSVEAADAFLKARAAEQAAPFELPAEDYVSEVRIDDPFGSKAVIFEGSEATECIVISLHGGAYAFHASPSHLAFCDALARKANATVVAPIYPLVPHHTCADAFAALEETYRGVLACGKPVFMYGDSAGGGLAVAFCMRLAELGLPEPISLILSSPWVDVSMSGDYEGYEQADPMLGVPGLRRLGEAWAGDLPTSDWRVSPLFGDLSVLPHVLLFVGTREVFYPDVIALNEKLGAAGVDHELVIGRGLNHVWPQHPIPEARGAQRRIVREIAR